MQQTEKYQLNLIETGDTFSPAALNENAQKTEAALDTKVDTTAHDALDERVTVLEGHKFVAGYYVGTGKSTGDTQTIELGFTPIAVIMNAGICLDGTAGLSTASIVPGGFKVTYKENASSPLNRSGIKHAYFAVC